MAVSADEEEKELVFEHRGVLGEKVIVSLPMAALDERVEELWFRVYDNRDDNDDNVYILPSVLYVHLCHDEGSVQIKKHRQIIKR